MKTLQIAVVDDHAPDRAWMRDRLTDYLTRAQLSFHLWEFPRGEDFVAGLDTQRFDIVFMDIYLDGITGVEAAGALRSRDKDCKLVFLTSSEDFMRQGFALNSAHYLVKPVREEDFWQAMENCRLRRQVQVPVLSVPLGRQSLEVDTLELCYVVMEGRMVAVHTLRGVRNAGRKFSAVAGPLLADRRFLLCNKALLLNMDYIADQEGDFFRMKDGSLQPMAHRRKQEVLAQYRNYVFGSMGGVT